jgi:hypothetical protein
MALRHHRSTWTFGGWSPRPAGSPAWPTSQHANAARLPVPAHGRRTRGTAPCRRRRCRSDVDEGQAVVTDHTVRQRALARRSDSGSRTAVTAPVAVAAPVEGRRHRGPTEERRPAPSPDIDVLQRPDEQRQEASSRALRPDVVCTRGMPCSVATTLEASSAAPPALRPAADCSTEARIARQARIRSACRRPPRPQGRPPPASTESGSAEHRTQRDGRHRPAAGGRTPPARRAGERSRRSDTTYLSCTNAGPSERQQPREVPSTAVVAARTRTLPLRQGPTVARRSDRANDPDAPCRDRARTSTPHAGGRPCSQPSARFTRTDVRAV